MRFFKIIPSIFICALTLTGTAYAGSMNVVDIGSMQQRPDGLYQQVSININPSSRYKVVVFPADKNISTATGLIPITKRVQVENSKQIFQDINPNGIVLNVNDVKNNNIVINVKVKTNEADEANLQSFNLTYKLFENDCESQSIVKNYTYAIRPIQEITTLSDMPIIKINSNEVFSKNIELPSIVSTNVSNLGLKSNTKWKLSLTLAEPAPRGINYYCKIAQVPESSTNEAKNGRTIEIKHNIPISLIRGNATISKVTKELEAQNLKIEFYAMNKKNNFIESGNITNGLIFNLEQDER